VLQAIVLEIIAKEWKVYLAAKLMSGVASAYLGPGLVAYMTEIAMPNMRGAMVVPFAFMFAFGSFLGALALQIVKMVRISVQHISIIVPIADLLTDGSPCLQARVLFAIRTLGSMVDPLHHFARDTKYVRPVTVSAPSPDLSSLVFYCKRGQHDKAKKSLRFLVGNVEGYDIEHEYRVVQREVYDSDEAMKLHGATGWYSLLKWKVFRRTIISVLPVMMQVSEALPAAKRKADALTSSLGYRGSRSHFWILCVSAHASRHRPQADFAYV
jgi:MFS family permease